MTEIKLTKEDWEMILKALDSYPMRYLAQQMMNKMLGAVIEDRADSITDKLKVKMKEEEEEKKSEAEMQRDNKIIEVIKAKIIMLQASGEL